MNATPILPGLSAVEGKLLTATFDAGRLSSDGGVIVLREIAKRLDLAGTITGPLSDDRDPVRVRHSYWRDGDGADGHDRSRIRGLR